MASIDPTVARVLDRRRNQNDSSDDEDALIAELENEDSTNADSATLSHLREKRLEQLHSELQRASLMRESQHGQYTELKDEGELLRVTTTTKLSVVLFLKPDFARCGIMEAKLRVLAEKHFDTRFVGINVENAPFVVVKLAVQVLPCVLAFIDGVSVDRIVGFEGLGTRPDGFTVKELEDRLLACGVLVRGKVGREDEGSVSRRREEREREEEFDDDDDWD